MSLFRVHFNDKGDTKRFIASCLTAAKYMALRKEDSVIEHNKLMDELFRVLSQSTNPKVNVTYLGKLLKEDFKPILKLYIDKYFDEPNEKLLFQEYLKISTGENSLYSDLIEIDPELKYLKKWNIEEAEAKADKPSLVVRQQIVGTKCDICRVCNVVTIA